MSESPQDRWVRIAWELGTRVLAAWASDQNFQKLWTPEPDLFPLDHTCAEVAKLWAELGPAAAGLDQTLWELNRRGKLAAAGGASAVEGLLLATPAIIDPLKHLEELRRHIALRALRMEMIKLAGRIEAGDCTLEEAEGALQDVIRSGRVGREVTRMYSIRDLFTELIEEQRATPENQEPKFSSGWTAIDEATGGIELGLGWIVGAQTNWGKTSFAIACLLAALSNQQRFGLVTCEDPRKLFGRRIMARLANVSAVKLRDRNLGRDEWSRVITEYGRADDQPFLLDARGGKPIERTVAEMRTMSRLEGIKFWLFDYIQAANTQHHFQKRVEKVGHVARTLFDFFEGEHVAGLAFSQLTMPDTARRPSWEDLRDNKDMAHMAAVVVIGFNEKIRGSRESKRVLVVDKNKDGPCGTDVEAEFDSTTASFQNDVGAQRALFEGGL